MMDLEDLQNWVQELEDRVIALEQRREGDERHCVTCGVELPPLGQLGHNVRFEQGIEAHYCDEH